jgi:hypothetical protein
MAERTKHLFRFPAAKIAAAAAGEANYHDERLSYWQEELEKATVTVERTASVSVKRLDHSNGWSPQVIVDYGDQTAYRRMQEAGSKIQTHIVARDRFKSDAQLYSTQGDRAYDLDAEDVSHFRFNGRIRDV